MIRSFMLVSRAFRDISYESASWHSVHFSQDLNFRSLALKKFLPSPTLFASYCERWQQLVYLNLSECYFLTDAYLVPILVHCSNLQRLNLSNCKKFSQAAFIYLCEKAPPSLVWLDISKTRPSNVCAFFSLFHQTGGTQNHCLLVLMLKRKCCVMFSCSSTPFFLLVRLLPFFALSFSLLFLFVRPLSVASCISIN